MMLYGVVNTARSLFFVRNDRLGAWMLEVFIDKIQCTA